ncbi:chemotaxis protein [Devosia epidermidihirudinis]|uniref:Chemotaxis protein n=1 Tax=Devosia epidermidihirudinis TaxID=1293439 RepID=A0A0F5QCZ5_9HYPH|nr:chemotaxis protein [Devosia epidermidihirudinis]
MEADRATLAAVSRSQAVIEFALDGTILTANANFLAAMGYELSEIVGKNHSIFMPSEDLGSDGYRLFWDRLRSGQYNAAEYKRLGKGGREVWIQASYNPVYNGKGELFKVVKFATDVTAAKLKAADISGQLAAISKSQAVIEFTTQGEVLTANANFCDAMGYSLEEIVGRHHRMFVAPEFARSEEYALFWEKLSRGEFQAAEYLRIGKSGRRIWIQATYNPIFDMNGKPFKVVKYATDITGRKLAVQRLNEGLGSLAAGDLTSTIDEKFVGELEEVRGAYNTTIGKFADIVGKIRETSGSLRAATSEILSGANDLSERTTRQATAIEETSATMRQLAMTVSDNAKRAETASSKSAVVSRTAEETGAVMENANLAMERISTSSSRISNIIGLIDDIAFQTNLLALNASVEAARAGDAGKGFGVVAVEVRRLAQSAAAASSEVKLLVEQSANEVLGGSRLVADATSKLQTMLEGVKENDSLVQGISRASQEQAIAIQQVGAAIRQMDEMTQHNAALVEETNAAVEQTDAQAVDLDRTVEVFLIDTPVSAAKRVETPRRRSESSYAAARTYLVDGSAALKTEWNDF